MERSIKSNQRQVRQLCIIISADGTTVTGLDKNQVSVADTATGVKTITLSRPFADDDYCVQVTTATADSHAEVSISDNATCVINTFDNTDGTTAKDAICHVTIIGSDILSRY